MASDRDPSITLRAGVEIIALALLPVDPSRQVYTILRKCFVDYFGEFLDSVFAEKSPEWRLKISQTQKRFEEVVSWVSPPYKPMTSEQALSLIDGASPAVWRDAVLRSVGKHPRRGQPRSKRHLAVWALDMKCLDPSLTLRAATDVLCPCGKATGQHTDKCREQLRQQINRLVKFLKTLGYDFTWERIGADGRRESE